MRRYIGSGKITTIVSPADVLVGDLVLVGSLFGLANENAKSGEALDIFVQSGAIVRVPKASGSIAAGDPLYFDEAEGNVTPTEGANQGVGVCVKAAGADDAEVEMRLLLPPGAGTGPQGPQGPAGTNGTNGTNGADGADGADGQGVPTGGTTGQLLAKASNDDLDTEFIDPPSGGGDLISLPAAFVLTGPQVDNSSVETLLQAVDIPVADFEHLGRRVYDFGGQVKAKAGGADITLKAYLGVRAYAEYVFTGGAQPTDDQTCEVSDNATFTTYFVFDDDNDAGAWGAFGATIKKVTIGATATDTAAELASVANTWAAANGNPFVAVAGTTGGDPSVRFYSTLVGTGPNGVWTVKKWDSNASTLLSTANFANGQGGVFATMTKTGLDTAGANVLWESQILLLWATLGGTDYATGKMLTTLADMTTGVIATGFPLNNVAAPTAKPTVDMLLQITGKYAAADADNEINFQDILGYKIAAG